MFSVLIESKLFKVRNFKQFIAFLVCISIFLSNALAKSTAEFGQDLSPLNHTYIHDLLTHMREIRSEANALPSDVSPFVSRASILPLMIDTALLYPWVAFNIGLDPHKLVYSLLSLTKGVDAGNLLFKNSSIRENIRGNVVLGHLYKYSPYLRLGYDFIPLGHHVFDTASPQSSVTRAMCSNKQTIIEMGGSYSNVQAQLQGSFAFCIEREVPILNAQYERKIPTQISSFLVVEHYRVGGGIDAAVSYGMRRRFFNLYSCIDFLKVYNFRFEYIYNTFFDTIGVNKKRNNIFKVHPCAFKMEVARQFSKVPIIGWDIPWSVLGGCENLTDKDNHTLKNNYFSAFKVELWNKHLLLVVGVQCDRLERNEVSSLLHIRVSL